MTIQSGVWHLSSRGDQVLLFNNDGVNYYKGHEPVPHIWRRGTDVNTMSLTENGNLRASGAFTTVSDTRIKKDIEDVDDEDSLN